MNEKFGRWTRLAHRGRMSDCICDCGTKRTVLTGDLVNGRTKSCGCGRFTHSLTKSPEYRIWTDIIRRCHNPKRPDYHRYGGRGITVCDRWRNSFEAFFEDMGQRPKGKTLDRKDNDGPYSSDNCVWATRKQQGRNTRQNKRVTYKGQTMTLVEACEKSGLTKNAVQGRLRRGWTIERALSEPVQDNWRSRRA